MGDVLAFINPTNRPCTVGGAKFGTSHMIHDSLVLHVPGAQHHPSGLLIEGPISFADLATMGDGENFPKLLVLLPP
jgi:hypothetical protein